MRIRNESGYCDKEINALLKNLEAELDQSKRMILLKELLTRLSQDVPQANVGFIPEFFTLHESVKGFHTDLNGSFWWWGSGLQHDWLDK